MAFNAMPNPQVLARAPIPISLNSTIFRIAVNDAAGTVPEASPGAGAAGTAGNAFVSLPGRLPLLEATDGACNALVAAPSTIAFSTSTKTWVFRGPRPEQGYLYLYSYNPFFLQP